MIDLRSAALLVMDYQPSILGSLADPEAPVRTVRSVMEAVRAQDGHVGFVRVAFTDEDYAKFPDGSMMGARAKAGRPNLDDGSLGASVHPALAPRPADLAVRKTRVGAFSTTDLHERLMAKGVKTLVLAGVHTSGVVLSTVREAHDLDYALVVVADACADPDVEVHAFLTNRIFPKQGRVVSAAELVGQLR